MTRPNGRVIVFADELTISERHFKAQSYAWALNFDSRLWEWLANYGNVATTKWSQSRATSGHSAAASHATGMHGFTVIDREFFSCIDGTAAVNFHTAIGEA